MGLQRTRTMFRSMLTRREWLRRGGLSAVALTMGNKLTEIAVEASPSGESPKEPLLKRLIETGMDNMLRWALGRMAKISPEAAVQRGEGRPADAPHNVGRAIDALLFGEAVMGKRIPPRAEETLRQHLFATLDNPTHLNGRFVPEAGRFLVHAHHVREAVLALTALIRYRNDDQARKLAHKVLDSLFRLTRPDGTFDADEVAKHPSMVEGWPSYGGRFREQIEEAGKTQTIACNTRGRMIMALCKYYRVTQEDRALELADRFVRLVRRKSFTPEGKIQPTEQGHTHSITGTVHGLIDFGLLASDREVFEHGRRIFDVGLPAVSSSFGWSMENAWGDDSPPRPWRGEVNNTGDMVQAALWLGRSGLPQYFEDAERRIRSHIVPSQCTDDGWGVPAPSDREGGSGTASILDITAGAVQALCETAETLVTQEDKCQSVNLPFSTWKGPVRVQSSLPEKWQLEVTPEAAGNLRVRIPSWAERERVHVTVDGQQRPGAFEDTWLVLEGVAAGQTVNISLPLVEREVTEAIKDRNYRVLWRGDQVVAMSPAGEVEPMYPSVEEYRAASAQQGARDG